MKEQQKEKNPVYQVVRPYIYEGTVACVLDYVVFQFPSLLMLIFYGYDSKFTQMYVLVYAHGMRMHTCYQNALIICNM